jgi:hypothetical protein
MGTNVRRHYKIARFSMKLSSDVDMAMGNSSLHTQENSSEQTQSMIHPGSYNMWAYISNE